MKALARNEGAKPLALELRETALAPVSSSPFGAQVSATLALLVVIWMWTTARALLLLISFHATSTTAEFGSAAFLMISPLFCMPAPFMSTTQDRVQVIAEALLPAVLPLLAMTWKSEDGIIARRRQRWFGLSLTLVVSAALPISAGGCVLARPIINLICGVEFYSAAPLLSVLILAFPAICLGYLAVGLEPASARTRLYAAVAAAVMAVSNRAANVLPIPQFGAVAAAWLTVASKWMVAPTLLSLLTLKTSVTGRWRTWSKAVLQPWSCY